MKILQSPWFERFAVWVMLSAIAINVLNWLDLF